MEICVLRSGSSGNCTYIKYKETKLLLDAGGMSQRRMRELLVDEIELLPEQLSGLLITHTHSDHINYSALKVCEKCNIPLYVHEDNLSAMGKAFGTKVMSNIEIRKFNNAPFEIDENIEVIPFEVSHDALKTTSGFSLIDASGMKCTYAADLGHFPDSLVEQFIESKVIFLEANHDVELLWKNPDRPYIHKKRVTGDYGHLSNDQSAEALLKILDKTDAVPEKIVLCHLSNDHNSPALALETIGGIFKKNNIHIPLVAAMRHEKTETFII